MAHGPATQWGEDKASDYKARLGIYLFIFYCIVYAGFIIINVMALAHPWVSCFKPHGIMGACHSHFF